MAWLRSYLLRSTHQWIVDHSMTPYLLIDALQEGVVVPEAYVEDGQIVLNMAPSAIRNLVISDDGIFFEASFFGEAFSIAVPYVAVVSLYAKESGQGIYVNESEGEFGLFVNELDEETLLPEPAAPAKAIEKETKEGISKRLAKSGLKVVK
jgi:stringent starvation protein B